MATQVRENRVKNMLKNSELVLRAEGNQMAMSNNAMIAAVNIAPACILERGAR